MRLKKLVKEILMLDYHIGPLVVFLLLVDVVLQVLSRIIPGNAFSWTLEVGEMLMGTLIWMGIGVAVEKNAHVGFDLVTKKLPPLYRKIFGLISNTLFIIYLVLMANFTVSVLQQYVKLGNKSTILGISMFWVRLPILIGCFIAVARLLFKQYRVFTDKELMFAEEDYELAHNKENALKEEEIQCR